MKLIQIKTGINLLDRDIISVKIGKLVCDMMVFDKTISTFKARNSDSSIRLCWETESLLLDTKGEYFYTPIKILGVVIDAEIEPFLGYSVLSENNLPQPLKPSIFKNGDKQITGWVTNNKEIFSTKGIFKLSDFKYCKCI